MKRQIQILTLAVILLFSAGAVFAQKATRLKFGKGATMITASGHLNGYKDQKVFVVRVRKGQTLKTEQVGKNYITVGIQSPSGEEVNDADASCNNRKEVAPTEAGDYKITVVECGKADPWRGTFRLRIKIK